MHVMYYALQKKDTCHELSDLKGININNAVL